MPKNKPVQVWYPPEVHAKLIRIKYLLYIEKGIHTTIEKVAKEATICGLQELCNEYKIEL